jgi:cytochrome P450
VSAVDHTNVPTTEQIGSLGETEGVEPWDYYDRLRELGDVVWDETMNAWLVSSYELVKEIGRKDEELYERNYVPREGRKQLGMTPEEWMHFIGGGSTQAQPALLTGEEHERQHRWWMRAFSPRVLSQWRETLFRPICNEEIDRFSGRGSAELVAEYAERITPRVMASMLGLPHDDDAWVARMVELFEARVAVRQRHSLGGDVDAKLRQEALDSTTELHAAIGPYVLERKGSDGDDFISMVWRDAPALFGGPYEDVDVVGVVVSAWGSGAGSIARGVCNALYLLLRRPDLHERLLADEETMKNFTEESLRLYGPVSWSPRYTKADVELGGVRIRKGELVIALNLAAQRDERRYPDPTGVDLARPSPRDHFSFFAGPRTCPGQGLARVELDVFLAVLLERLPDIRLDPAAESPRYKGVLTRSWEPLNVTFAPA